MPPGGPLLLGTAFLVDMLVGDPPWLFHPVRIIGRAIELGEKILRLICRRPFGELVGGVVLAAAVTGGAFFGAWFLLFWLGRWSPWLAWGANLWLLSTTLAARGLAGAGREVYSPLQEGNLAGAAAALANYVGRDTQKLPAAELARGTIETIAENTGDGVIAPLFYALLGGAPLALAYKAVNTLDSMIGYKNDRYWFFGRPAARLDDWANYIPARFAGVMLVLASAFGRFNVCASFQEMRHGGRAHASPNSGVPEAAMAGALGVCLGGTNYYDGRRVDHPLINPEGRPPDPQDILRAGRLMYGASILAVVLFVLTLVFLGKTHLLDTVFGIWLWS